MCKNRSRTKSAFSQSSGSFPGPTWSCLGSVLGITLGKTPSFGAATDYFGLQEDWKQLEENPAHGREKGQL